MAEYVKLKQESEKKEGIFFEIFSGFTLSYDCKWTCLQYEDGDDSGGQNKRIRGTRFDRTRTEDAGNMP